MKHFLAALVASSCTSLTAAQQGAWEQVFPFGPANHEIFPIHLVHVFDGSLGRVVAISREHSDADCDPEDSPVKTFLWIPPAVGSPPGTPGAFDDVSLCRTHIPPCTMARYVKVGP